MTRDYYYVKPLRIGRPCSACRKVGPRLEAALNFLSDDPKFA
jgi:hypothetical protein